MGEQMEPLTVRFSAHHLDALRRHARARDYKSLSAFVREATTAYALGVTVTDPKFIGELAGIVRTMTAEFGKLSIAMLNIDKTGPEAVLQALSDAEEAGVETQRRLMLLQETLTG